jgi:HTH-type transcriptional regulator / antitoxin HigA
MEEQGAIVLPPGVILKEELEARGWAQVELAEIMGRPTKAINEIITGKKAITPETAVQLAEALGTSAALWMNLETQYQLSKVQTRDQAITRRAALYAEFPVREMLKRGWVQATDDFEELHQRFLSFFGMKSLQDKPAVAFAAKKTNSFEGVTMPQIAWLLRARQIASSRVFKRFDKQALRAALPALSALRTAPEEIRHVTRILADSGVRLVFVEALPGSKIDGACFWLEGEQPVVAMSLRLDRIDNFWFVLRHELEHVLKGHGKTLGFVLDQDIEGMDSEQIEKEEKLANAEAAQFCVDQAQLNDFIARVQPYFSEERVTLFAKRLGIHTGLVAGQLRRRLNRYDRWSAHLVKVRHIAIKSAPVDGWGVVDNS